jgi:hypothetical protein
VVLLEEWGKWQINIYVGLDWMLQDWFG